MDVLTGWILQEADCEMRLATWETLQNIFRINIGEGKEKKQKWIKEEVEF